MRFVFLFGRNTNTKKIKHKNSFHPNRAPRSHNTFPGRPMDIVREILEKEQRDLEKFKSIQVAKHLEVRTDLGLLMCSDPNDLDGKSLK